LSACSLFGNGHDSVARAKASNAEGPARATQDAANFLVEAVDARRMDYAEGALAVTHATTPELRAYGAEMTRDQTVLLKELTTLAATLRVVIPQTIGEDKQGPLQALVDEQGIEFDKRFISMMTIDHERDVKAFTDGLSSIAAARVARYACRLSCLGALTWLHA
jgi:predicted outer membrane protein